MAALVLYACAFLFLVSAAEYYLRDSPVPPGGVYLVAGTAYGLI